MEVEKRVNLKETVSPVPPTDGGGTGEKSVT